MIIKCKNCKGDNPLGSIFCRACGAKLDMEDIDKNIKKSMKRRKIFNIFSSFFRIILVALFITAIYGAYLIFDPVKYFRIVSTLPKDQEVSTMALYDRMDMGMPGTYRLSEAQLSYLATRLLGKKGNVITISFPDNKYFGFTITKNLITYSSMKLNAKVTAVCELFIEKDKRGKSSLTANLKYLKLGELKLPEWYNQLFIKDFNPYASSKKLEGFLKKIDEIRIENGQMEMVFDGE